MNIWDPKRRFFLLALPLLSIFLLCPGLCEGFQLDEVGIARATTDIHMDGISSSHIFSSVYSLLYFTSSQPRGAGTKGAGHISLGFTPTWHNTTEHWAMDYGFVVPAKEEIQVLMEKYYNAVVIGPTSSFSCESLALDSVMYAVPVISVCTEELLGQKWKYPFYVKAQASSQAEFEAIASLMVSLGWSSVSVLERADTTSSALSVFQSECEKRKIRIVNSFSLIVTDFKAMTDSIIKIRESGSRIVLVLGGSIFVRNLFPLFLQQGVLGSQGFVLLGTEQWGKTSIFRLVPGHLRNWLYGAIVVRSGYDSRVPLVEEYRAASLKQRSELRNFLGQAPGGANASPTLNAAVGLDMNILYKLGLQFPILVEGRYLRTLEITNLTLRAIDSATQILNHYNVKSACLNFKHFSETSKAGSTECHLPNELITYIFRRSQCDMSYLNATVNSAITKLNGYDASKPCVQQSGVINAFSIYSTGPSDTLKAMVASPGLLLLQRIYETTIVSASGNTISIDSQGNFNGVDIEIMNSLAVPLNESESQFNASEAVLSAASAMSSGENMFSTNNDTNSSFYGFIVELRQIGLIKPGGAIEMFQSPIFFSTDPRTPNTVIPADMVTEDSSNTLSTAVIIAIAAGALASVLLAFVMYFYSRRHSEMSEDLWLIHEEELVDVPHPNATLKEESGNSRIERSIGALRGLSSNNFSLALSKTPRASVCKKTSTGPIGLLESTGRESKLIKSSILSPADNRQETFSNSNGAQEEMVASGMYTLKRRKRGLSLYREEYVYWKMFEVHSPIASDSGILRELKQCRIVSCKELNNFIGMTISNVRSGVFLCKTMWMFERRGSVRDFLRARNDYEFRNDPTLSASMMMDISKGLEYIHKTVGLSFHGSLSSSKCILDDRWTCKITDYGLHHLRSKQFDSIKQRESAESETQTSSTDREPIHIQTADTLVLSKIFYFSHERLGTVRNLFYDHHEANGSSKAEDLRVDILANSKDILQYLDRPFHPGGCVADDLFACGIIFHEIWSQTPFVLESVVNKRTINGVLEDMWNDSMTVIDCLSTSLSDSNVQELVSKLTDRDASKRPVAKTLINNLASIFPQLKSSFTDLLSQKLQAYTQNLENLVAEQTEELRGEKDKITALVHEMLPPSIADELLSEGGVAPMHFSSVTVFFNDIVGFTSLCDVNSASNIIFMLNELFTKFDSITKHIDVVKITTIGDAYMAVSGVPQRNGMNHAKEICIFSLEMLKTLSDFTVPFDNSIKLKMRAGINSGPVMAGVLGTTVPQFSIFGDTVNLASRMESTGMPERVQMSHFTYKILQEHFPNIFKISERGIVAVKGKADVQTYWLEDIGQMPAQQESR
eukprot:Nk52_evm11s1763 gene=Nk52_evmTU11s1763